MNNSVLIAGGSGLIGRALSVLLQANGWDVTHLSRKAKTGSVFRTIEWDPSVKRIPADAFKGISHLVNLSGEPVADHRWSKNIKHKILQSRLDATTTLVNALHTIPNNISALVAASAVGYYGDRGTTLLKEIDQKGDGFLADVVDAWEKAHNASPVRTVLLRTGIVLDKKDAALAKLSKPLGFGLAPVLGKGDQYMSWIHIDDIAGIYFKALSDPNVKGVYNAVAPNPVTNAEFMDSLKNQLKPHAVKFAVPATLLKIILGDRSHVVLDSIRVDASRLINTGYIFQYSTAKEALKAIYA